MEQMRGKSQEVGGLGRIFCLHCQEQRRYSGNLVLQQEERRRIFKKRRQTISGLLLIGDVRVPSSRWKRPREDGEDDAENDKGVSE